MSARNCFTSAAQALAFTALSTQRRRATVQCDNKGAALGLTAFHVKQRARLAEELEARQGQCPVGLLGFSVACDHSAADVAAGGCSRATTECLIPAHPRAAVAANLRNHAAVRLMKRHGRHCLGGACDGQSKCNSDEPEHCFLHIIPSRKKEDAQPLHAAGRLKRVCYENAGRERPAQTDHIFGWTGGLPMKTMWSVTE